MRASGGAAVSTAAVVRAHRHARAKRRTPTLAFSRAAKTDDARALTQLSNHTMSTSTEPARKSARTSKAPLRLRPGNSDCPAELCELIHSVATDAADKSKVPFEPDAVVALEEALEPMLEALCEQAFKVAEAQGRDEISEHDLRAVAKTLMSKK